MGMDVPLRVIHRARWVAALAALLSLLALTVAADDAAAQADPNCDDPEYVENFFEGDRAACLNQGGCTICGGDDGGGSGDRGAVTTKPELLAVPKSLRLGRLLKRGIRFRVAVAQSDSTVSASLALKGSKVGKLRKSGLAAGRRSLTLKLSRKGRAKLRRALKRKQKVKASLKVSVSGTGFTQAIVVKR